MLTLLIAATALHQQPTLNLSLLPSGTFKRLGGYRPFGAELSPTKPAGITKAPEMASPQYGIIKIGTHQFFVAMDGKDKVYVDSNGDGDLTDDPAAEWGPKTVTRGTQSHTYLEGSATVDLPIDGKTVPCTIGLYEAGKYLGYYMDFSKVGDVKVGAKSYQTMYVDESAVWNGKAGILVIDEKGDGHLGPMLFHPVGQPFMLGGKEFEFGSKGDAPDLLPSTKKIVPPTPPGDPNLGNGLKAGSPVRTFEAKTTNGHQVSFPGSFKGKVVMLDFWATWCGPCMREVPNVVKAYQAYHGRGFEVLGVSLDQPDSGAAVKDVTGKEGMVWDQIYDGKAFSAAVAKQYGIKAIPEAYLVDGDTGKIIAFGDAIRGEKLQLAIKQALAAKQGATPK